MLSAQDENQYLDPSLVSPESSRMTMDHQYPSPVSKNEGFLGLYPTKTLSEPNKTGNTTKVLDRSFTDPRMAPIDPGDAQMMVNSTSQPPVFTPEDLASMFSEVMNQVDANKYSNKDELQQAMKNSALNLLGPNKSKKRTHTDSPSGSAIADSEKHFQCKWCVKKKRTQCELKYDTSSKRSVIEDEMIGLTKQQPQETRKATHPPLRLHIPQLSP